jgi:hypothetical protein
MRRLFVCFGLLAVLPVLWPSEAAGQKPKKNTPKLEDATDEDYAAIRKLKDISGTLTAFDPEAKTLTLRYEYQTYEPIPLKPNPRAGQQYNNLLRTQQRLMNDYQQILRARNPAQQQRRMQRWMLDYQRFQQQAAQMGVQAKYKTVAHAKEFDFDVSAEVKVARSKPPMEYDDKGNIKEYTKEELKKMRDPDMPGYTARIDDLQAGQTVKLYLGKPKAKKSSSPSKKEGDDTKKGDDPKAKGDDTTKKADEPAKKSGDDAKSSSKSKTDEKGPQLAFVRQILILTDADPDFQKTQPKKRKKGDQ